MILRRKRLTLKARTKIYYLHKVVLLFLDIFAINLSFIHSFYAFRYEQTFYGKPITDLGVNHIISLIAITAVWIYIFKEKGLYKSVVYTRLTVQAGLIFKSVSMGTLFFLGASYMMKSPYFIERRDLLFAAWLYSICFIILFRMAVIYPFLKYISAKGLDKKRVIILGAGESGMKLACQLMQSSRAGYAVLGFLDDNPKLKNQSFFEVPVLGPINDLARIAKERHVKEVMLAITNITHKRILELIGECKRLRINLKIMSDLFAVLTEKVTIETLAGIPLIGIKEPRLQGINRILKRAMDFAGSCAALVCLSPLFLAIGLLVKFTSKGPVFYRQLRIGRNMKPFRIYKFRSMYQDSDENRHQEYIKDYINGKAKQYTDERGQPVHKLVDDNRITPAGKILRKTSLDELPQLFNVFKGEMSLVGPRPPIPYEVKHYGDWHNRRLDTWPGITGLWQVSGRNQMDFNEMVILDIYYIENWSVWLDVQILISTIPALLKHSKGY